MHLNPVDSREWLIKYYRDGDHRKNFKGPEWGCGRSTRSGVVVLALVCVMKEMAV